MTTRTEPDLLQRLISADIIHAHPYPETVTGADLDALKAILRGDTRPDFPVDHKGALDLLSRSETSPEAAAILAGALNDASAPVVIRMAAAHLLRRMPAETAETLLVPALGADDNRVRRAVYRSLAEVGGSMAQRALADQPKTPELNSAQLLISLRLGTHRGSLTSVLGSRSGTRSSAPGTGSRQVKAEPLPEDEARRILDSLGGGVADVPLTSRAAIGFACRNARYAVLLAENVDFDRSGIIGAVTRDGKHTSGSELRYLVLYAATTGEFEIALITPAGRVDYTGAGTALRAGMRFQLQQTDAALIPLNATAEMTETALRLSLDIPELADRAARRGRTAQPVLTSERAGAR